MASTKEKHYQERAQRYKIRAPLAVEREAEQIFSAKIHDISSSGIAFESDLNQMLGGFIDFVISLEIDHEPIMMKCKAKIVRLEENERKNLVAAQIIESQLIK